MPSTELKGTFNLAEFRKKVEGATEAFDFPMLEYTIGEGETLDDLFDTLVTYPALHGNKSIERQFKGDMGYNKPLAGGGNLKGKTLYLNISWLKNSKGIPQEVQSAINEAKRKERGLISQETQQGEN